MGTPVSLQWSFCYQGCQYPDTAAICNPDHRLAPPALPVGCGGVETRYKLSCELNSVAPVTFLIPAWCECTGASVVQLEDQVEVVS